MRKLGALALAIMIVTIIHEGTHTVTAILFDEYQALKIHPYGWEVIFKSPVDVRQGIKWGFISGMSNFATLTLGYIMFLGRASLVRMKTSFLGLICYWLIVLLLLVDAFNLSIGPFIYGGDINGIAVGFGINQYLVQCIFFFILLFNRELLVQKLFPLYGVKTAHPFFRPWIRQERNT